MGLFLAGFGAKKQKRIPFLKNEAEKLLIINDQLPKTNRNEPKNEAEKLLKTRSCEKNEPKNEPGHVVENTGTPRFTPQMPKLKIPSLGQVPIPLNHIYELLPVKAIPGCMSSTETPVPLQGGLSGAILLCPFQTRDHSRLQR